MNHFHCDVTVMSLCQSERMALFQYINFSFVSGTFMFPESIACLNILCGVTFSEGLSDSGTVT